MSAAVRSMADTAVVGPEPMGVGLPWQPMHDPWPMTLPSKVPPSLSSSPVMSIIVRIAGSAFDLNKSSAVQPWFAPIPGVDVSLLKAILSWPAESQRVRIILPV